MHRLCPSLYCFIIAASSVVSRHLMLEFLTNSICFVHLSENAMCYTLKIDVTIPLKSNLKLTLNTQVTFHEKARFQKLSSL